METIILMKDGTAILQGKVCPFRAPLVLPSQTIAGQLTIQNIPCSDACSLFKINKEQCEVELHCAGSKVFSFEVDFKTQQEIEKEAKTETKKSNLTLI